MTGVDPKGKSWRDIPVDDETLSYVIQYGGRCRECADNFGICSTGLPCKPDEARAAIRHVLRAINYGMSHGYLPAALTPLKGAQDGPEEIEIDRLRLAAFKTNSNEDKAAYYLAVSKWFQDRHYRPLFASQPLPETEEKATAPEAAAKPCGVASPSYHDCPNMKEVGGGMEGERYRCAVCGKGYFLDYEEMK